MNNFKIMKKIIFALLIIHCSLLIANAQWVQLNPSPGLVHSLIVNNSNIFAGANRVFRSTNYGLNWTDANLDNRLVYSLTVSGNNLFAGTSLNGVYISTNNGTNWTQTALNNLTVWSLTANGSNIFAGTANLGIYLSTNNGTNWTQTSLNNKTILSLEVNGVTIFAGTVYDGIYISSNNGINWNQTSLINKTVYSLAKSGSYIFAGTNFGVYLSTDNGINWVQTSMPAFGILSLAINGSNIAAGTWGFGVYLSKNNGETWKEKNEGFLPILSILPNIGSLLILNNYIFAGTYENSTWRRSFSEIIGIQNISTEIPSGFSLCQNYPNPFNPSTKIKFDISGEVKRKTLDVKLTVYNMLGKEVASLVNEQLQPGTYEVTFDARQPGLGSNLPSGVYFYQLRTDNFVQTKKLILLK